MGIIKGFRSLLNLRTLVVVLIFSCIVYYYYSHVDWELEIPVTVEKRIDLLAKVEEARPDWGFGGKDYYLRIHKSVIYDNEDNADMYILADAHSQFSYNDIPIYESASLKTGFGFFQVAEDTPLQPVTFEVEASWEEEKQIIFSETLTPRCAGNIKQFKYIETSLAALEDERVKLSFRCKTDSPVHAGLILCAWVNPVLDSKGSKAPLKKVKFKRTYPAFDFVESPLPSLEEARTKVWARDHEGNPLTYDAPFAKDFGFIPLSDPVANHSGARAALAFVEDHEIHLPRVRVPDGEEGRLSFAIGLKEVSAAAGGADFWIRMNGEERFRETIQGGELSCPWRDRSLDCSEFLGEEVEVTFGVKFHGQTAREVEVPVFNPIYEEGKHKTLMVEHAVAGFGHPKLTVSEMTGRRFSKITEPNLIVINIECLRSDHLGCYGSPLGLTPFMDNLADAGILYKDHVAAASWTLPSVATLLTGVYPSMHGVVKEDRSFLPNRFVTLPELMQQHGITTCAFITNQLLDRKANFDQGFESFVFAPYQNGRKVNSLFRNWLESNKEFRFFGYFHFFEPHDPCNAPGGLRDRYVPEPLRGKDEAGHKQAIHNLGQATRQRFDGEIQDDVDYVKGRYAGEIAYMDRRLKELVGLLDDYGLLRKTVVIVTGDHGEEIMEHDYIGHGCQLYNETIRVPLIIFGSKKLIGDQRVVEGMADNASLYSTVAALMDIPLDREEGQVVRPALYPVDKHFMGEDRLAFSETAKALIDPTVDPMEIKSLYSIMNWRYKLILDDQGNMRFFDLAEDPEELNDLSEGSSPDKKKLEKQLRAMRKQFDEQGETLYGPAMDALVLEKMRQLGYQ